MLLFVVGTFAFGFAFTFAFSGVTPHATVFGAVRKDFHMHHLCGETSVQDLSLAD